jgi:hypothetical protein
MSVMELKLERLIEAQRVISAVDSLDSNLPVVVRTQDPETSLTVAVVCSVIEPTEIILPMNVIWICFDKRSTLYAQALKRVSKAADPMTPGLKQTWEVLYFYEDVFEEQYYDPEDIEDVNTEPVGPANVTTLGIVLLNVPSISSGVPHIISDGHESLTNRRVPTAHSHPEKPATILYVSEIEELEQIEIIDQPAPEVGMALCSTNQTLQWRKLTVADLAEVNNG